MHEEKHLHFVGVFYCSKNSSLFSVNIGYEHEHDKFERTSIAMVC